MNAIKTIVISGYYGFDNSGDDAILKAIVEGFKNSDEKLNIIALSNDPPSTEKIYGIKAVYRFNIAEVKRVVKTCDLFISGGGSLLQDVTSTRSLLYYLMLMKIAKKYKRKVMVYANGVGPIDGRLNRLLTKNILEKVDLISLRDEESRDFIQELGVENRNVYVTADPVFSLEAISKEEADSILSKENIPRDKPLVGIAIRDWKNNESLIDNMARASDYMVESYGVNIVLIPMHYPEDLEISKRLLARIKNNSSYVLKEKYNVDEVMGVINELEMILAMRLHSLIYAATQEVPMIGIVYDPKIIGFLNTIGVSNMVDVENLVYEDIQANIDDVWKNKQGLRKGLNEQEEILKSKAMENIDMALDLLEE